MEIMQENSNYNLQVTLKLSHYFNELKPKAKTIRCSPFSIVINQAMSYDYGSLLTNTLLQSLVITIQHQKWSTNHTSLMNNRAQRNTKKEQYHLAFCEATLEN